MAPADAGEAEYESDPEEVKRSLAVRRREASDDDDDADEKVKNLRAEIDSDLSDEQNGSMKYDNDEDREDTLKEEEEEGDGIDNDKKSSLMKAAGDIDGEEEKEKQQSSVPTGGAFYMHDDRFQEMSVGQNRRMRGGKRPWGSGEERKWRHDKFEEMNTQGKHYDRTSRSRLRGHGRGRGQEREYTRGNSSNALTNHGQQIYLPKAVKQGRGPRKFETSQRKGNQAHSEQSKQSRNSHEKMSHPGSRRSPTALTKTGNVGAHAKKNVAASNLNSSSPPFYPSVPSSNLVHDIQGGMERLHMNETATPSGKKYRNTKSGFSSVWTAKTLQSTSQGRGAPAAGNVFNSHSHSQGDRVLSPIGNSEGTGQSCSIPSSQDFDQHSTVIRSLASPPQKTSTSRNRYPPGEIAIAKGKGTIPPSGSSPIMYSGSQMVGRAESLASGDNSNIPFFLPVMQLGGQHGGVPTFGMAYPGYVQSEDGVRNPEMTWMPVLTGPGASYSPPYVAHQAHKTGLSASLPSSAGTSSKENSTKNLSDLEKPMERHEVTEIMVSPQQNNNPSKQPRRYSEMSFAK